MKIAFEIYTEPQSTDLDDEIANILNDAGVMNMVENAIASEIQRQLGGRDWRIMAKYRAEITRDFRKYHVACKDAFRTLAQSNTYSEAENRAWTILGEALGAVHSDDLK